MKINLVNYEQGQNNGILTKFAVKLNEELVKLGQNCSITNVPDEKADVCHHINYLPYKHKNSPRSVNTLMVTHIWEGYKLEALKEGIKTATGVCMSPAEMNKLIGWGLPKENLTYVLPAHDSKPRRHQIVAILTNVYPDGCKREGMFKELVKTLDHDQWAFRIMGKGWETILPELVAEGLQVDYFHDFNYEIHQKILETSDYCLYFGQDEGSMAMLDAKNAGLKTIGTPQGFHLDIGLDYYFNTQEELNDIFKNLNPNPVKNWTWGKYAQEHLDIWNRLLNKS